VVGNFSANKNISEVSADSLQEQFYEAGIEDFFFSRLFN
jgi:hypothetical protein